MLTTTNAPKATPAALFAPTHTTDTMKIEIKTLAGSLLFEGDFSSIAEALTAAVKRGANLAGAYLAGANLDGAYLAGAVHRFAQVSFSEHGECGRMLSAVRLKEGEEIRLFCGCFTGSTQELRDYITTGAAHLRKTRTLALDTILVLIDAQNDAKTEN